MSQVGYCTGIDLYKLEYCEGIDVVNSIAPIAPLILPTETSHTHCTYYTVRIITYIALILAYCIAHISHLFEPRPDRVAAAPDVCRRRWPVGQLVQD